MNTVSSHVKNLNVKDVGGKTAHGHSTKERYTIIVVGNGEDNTEDTNAPW